MGALLHTRVKDELVARIGCLARGRIVKASGPDADTLMPDFVAGGLVSAIRRWIQDGRRLSARELVHKAQVLVGTLRRDGLPDAEPTDIA